MAMVKTGRIVKIQAVANTLPPGVFLIRHFNNEGELSAVDPANPNAFHDDSHFRLWEDNDTGAVKFEALRFPNKFLRHKNFSVLLEESTPGDSSFDDDSTFISSGPNVGAVLDGTSSFRAFDTVKFPNFFIRHRDFHVFLNEVTQDDEQAKQDSTFKVLDEA